MTPEMGGYLPDSWSTVIENDIDGESALSIQLDRKNANFDKVSSNRQIARTVFRLRADLPKREQGYRRLDNSAWCGPTGRERRAMRQKGEPTVRQLPFGIE
jgi:hypothetical protein